MDNKIKTIYVIISIGIVLLVGSIIFQEIRLQKLKKQYDFHNAMWTVMLSASPKEVQEAFISEVNKKLK